MKKNKPSASQKTGHAAVEVSLDKISQHYARLMRGDTLRARIQEESRLIDNKQGVENLMATAG